ncbi:hypothetical protein [Streptomyces virginiae]|uniref:hypothetical protein n=1 Tax=Streptomyces virginiae TaxID=1961 RepID=UPI0036E61989
MNSNEMVQNGRRFAGIARRAGVLALTAAALLVATQGDDLGWDSAPSRPQAAPQDLGWDAPASRRTAASDLGWDAPAPKQA